MLVRAKMQPAKKVDNHIHSTALHTLFDMYYLAANRGTRKRAMPNVPKETEVDTIYMCAAQRSESDSHMSQETHLELLSSQWATPGTAHACT